MFKEKSSKKRIGTTTSVKDVSTLDVMHNKMIKTFTAKSKEVSNMKLSLEKLNITHDIIRNNIKELSNKDEYDIAEYDTLWHSNIKLTEEIIDLKNKIHNIENDYNETEYYKQTSDILFDYYNLLENQSKNSNQCISTKIQIPTINSNKGGKSILEALNIINSPTVQKQTNTSNNSQVINDISTEKTDLVDEYLIITNKNHIRKNNSEDSELCKCCKKPMVCIQHDAIIICEECGYQELLLIEQNRPLLKQNTKDTSHFSYKRINHFREWCNQVQGKESTDIANEIFEKILNEIKKEKITDTKNISYNKMREILKRLRINKYYEHINYIINRINGVNTPQFSPELEEKLYKMFRDIQGPFLKHCPKDRKNFLSYSYVLYKFFQILGLNEYLKYFPLLKSREKLYVQDQIWKKICEELNYEFIPSPSL